MVGEAKTSFSIFDSINIVTTERLIEGCKFSNLTTASTDDKVVIAARKVLKSTILMNNNSLLGYTVSRAA